MPQIFCRAKLFKSTAAVTINLILPYTMSNTIFFQDFLVNNTRNGTIKSPLLPHIYGCDVISEIF